MRRLSSLMVVVILGIIAQQVNGESSSGVSYSRHWIKRTRVHVVWVNLNDKSLKVTPVVAWNSIGRRQSFVSFMAHHQPLAQMSGNFFSLRTAIPVGDIVIGGSKVCDGRVGSALAIKPGNQASIVDIPHRWRYSWPGYESVLRGGIRLLENGKTTLAPRSQGFRDPALFRAATRTAIGLDKRNRLLMVAVNKTISLSDMAGIMKALGCLSAMSLDGGTSTGLAYGDDVMVMPGRTLANVLLVVRRPEPPAKPPVMEPPPPAEPPAQPPVEGGTVIGPAPTTTIGPAPGQQGNILTTPAKSAPHLPTAPTPVPKPRLGDILRHVFRNMLVPFLL